MGTAIVTLKIMPQSPEVDLERIEENAKELIVEFAGEGDIKSKTEKVAFGLQSVNLTFSMDEDLGDTEDLEKKIETVDDVESVEVTDVRRAIG